MRKASFEVTVEDRDRQEVTLNLLSTPCLVLIRFFALLESRLSLALAYLSNKSKTRCFGACHVWFQHERVASSVRHLAGKAQEYGEAVTSPSPFHQEYRSHSVQVP